MGLRDFTDQTFEVAKKGINGFRRPSGTPLPPINSDIPTGAAPPGVLPAGTVPPASAAPAAKSGILQKVAGLGQMDVGPIASKAGNLAKTIGSGWVSGAGMVGHLANTAYQTANTDTDVFRRQLGMDTTDPSLVGDLAARGAGAVLNLGNSVTLGGATRLGNLIAGNGSTSNDEIEAQRRPKPPVTAAAPTTDTTATAPVVPPTATELSNQRMGLSVADQRRATDMTSSTNPLRDANKLQAMKRTPGADPAVYNLGKYGGSGDIYGTQSLGVGKIDTFTGTGDESANAAYEKSGQYQQGLRTAQMNRDLLAQARAENARAPTGGVATLANPVSTQAATGWRAGSMNLGSAQLRAQREALQVQREHNQMTNNSNILGHQIQDNNNRRNFDSSMYGHEIAASNNQKMREMEIQKLRLEQGNKDRSFNLDNAKFGREQSQDELNNKVKMDDHIKSQLGTMFTRDDGKGGAVPDDAKVGAYFKDIQNELGARIKDLSAIPKGDPQYAEAQQQIAKYNKGTAALQPDDIKDLLTLAARKERTREQHGIMLGRSTFVDSRLGGYSQKGVKYNRLGSDTITYDNGAEGRANDYRYDTTGNPIGLNLFKARTDKFGSLRIKD